MVDNKLVFSLELELHEVRDLDTVLAVHNILVIVELGACDSVRRIEPGWRAGEAVRDLRVVLHLCLWEDGGMLIPAKGEGRGICYCWNPRIS